jgi:hypothetical protein
MREALVLLAAANVAAIGFASHALAQLPSPSTRALGMGDNYTAAASGYSAVAWNPALLAFSERERANGRADERRPARSLALFAVRGVAGLSPIGLGDVSDWQGRNVPTSVREDWLRAIETDGREAGSAGGDATYVAAHFGRLGFQASSTLRAVGDLTPGAAELLFFGNAGRTGEPRALAVGGSEIRAHAASTIAVGYGLPVRAGKLGNAAVGVVVKYSVGHMLLLGRAGGSSVADQPAINLSFPTVGTSTEQLAPTARAGHGIGLDVGIATRLGGLTLGARMQNVLNTFSWNAAKLEYREGLAQFDYTITSTDFEAQTFENAPTELRQAVSDARFARTLSVGSAYEAAPRLMLTSDVRVRFGHTTLAEPNSFHLGSGAEYRLLPRMSLRGGAAVLAHGFQIGGGVGWKLGPLHLAGSLVRRSTDYGSGTVSMITLFSTTGE